MNEFHAGLADILEVEPSDLKSGMILSEYGWDSLAIISCVALIDECFGIVVSGTNLATCRTVADLDDLIAHNVPAQKIPA